MSTQTESKKPAVEHPGPNPLTMGRNHVVEVFHTIEQYTSDVHIEQHIDAMTDLISSYASNNDEEKMSEETVYHATRIIEFLIRMNRRGRIVMESCPDVIEWVRIDSEHGKKWADYIASNK